MSRSDRLPDHVELGQPAATEARNPGLISAPESLSLSGAVPVHRSERMSGTRRTGRRQLQDVLPELGQREWAILDSLQAHPFLTTTHLQTLHFFDHATPETATRIARRVLRRLSEQRVIEALDRRVGGIRAGSASFVWRIGPVGDRLLQQAAGEGIRRRRKEPSSYYLAHRLAIADAHLALITAARQGRFELASVETEPRCWRSYLGPHGGQDTLKPDLFVATAVGEYEDRWFIEVDRGTESIPTLIRKCAQYETYRRTGSEQQREGIFPLVVWQLPNQARIEKLRAALRASRRLDPSLYRLTTPDQLVAVIEGGAA
jgi:hypothetical protein